MKKLLVFLTVIAVGCGSSQKTASNKTENNEVVRQTTNTAEITSPQKSIQVQKNMLVGEFEAQELQQMPFSDWFEPAYNNYKMDEKALATIKENISDYEITIFMGTWCRDSKRETPKFIKILDEVGYDYNKLRMIAVDRSKKMPTGIDENFEIVRVPTIIFFKDGKEINRFVEFPQESFAEDIAKIVSGKNYTNSYAR